VPALPNITVVGAGIAGCASAIQLAEAGCEVTLFEHQADPVNEEALEGRSINLALSARGANVLDRLGLYGELAPMLVPMRGRVVHTPKGERFDSYDLLHEKTLHSVRRIDLLRALLERLREHPRVKLRLGHRVDAVQLGARSLLIRRPDKQLVPHGFDALIGADGVRSVVRNALANQCGLRAARRVHRHVYKELHVLPERGAKLDPHALHIWPRRNSMLIALPNHDRSFTATLFFEAGRGDEPRELAPDLFRRNYRDARELFVCPEQQLAGGNYGRIVTLDCAPWHDQRAVLLGDAAHAMAPFFGQGMNCALEDTLALTSLLQQEAFDVARAFARYQQQRERDVATICQLSMHHYREMRDGVLDPLHELRRELEGALQARHPGRYMPLYAMISFSCLPYSVAQARADLQRSITDRLLTEVKALSEVDFARADQLVSALPPLPAGI
jgi:kynurenine 3-monooxygenase